VWDKAKAANRDPGPQLERVQAKVKTKSGTRQKLIARAQAPDKPEKDPEMERVLGKVETKRAT
jgi:hypothetical protein